MNRNRLMAVVLAFAAPAVQAQTASDEETRIRIQCLLTPVELTGRDVITLVDEQLGTVDDVVRNENNTVHAVISVGGFLGAGDDKIAVPVADLQIEGEKVKLTTSDSREELERRAKAHDPAGYRSLTGK